MAMPVLQTDPNELITSCGREILVQMRYACGVGNDRFKTQYLPLLYKLAQFVQTAPLKNDAYSELGGAFKFGLTAALLTLRMSNGVLFTTNGGAERMGRLTPQYRFCAFAASLATVPLIVSHYVAITVNGLPWHFFDAKKSLFTALANNAQGEFAWVNPQVAPHPSLAILTLNGFFEPEIWQSFEPIVLQEMCMAINPALHQPPIESKLAEVVRMGHEKALLIDQQERQHRFDGEQGSVIDTGNLSNQTIESSGPSKVPMSGATDIEEKSLFPPHQTSAPGSVEVPGAASVRSSTSSDDVSATPSDINASDFFREWVSSVLMDDKKREKLTFQDNGVVVAHASLLSGYGMSPLELAERFLTEGVATEKNSKARTITFKSFVTPLFKGVAHA